MKRLLLSFAAISFASGLFAQFNVSINPSQDNAIFSESANSSGAGKLYSGRTNAGNFRRALMQFDIAAAVPAGATITAVTLDLTIDQVPPLAVAGDFDLRPVLTAWGEGTSVASGSGAPAVAPDATWTDAMFGTSTWITPGGDFGPVSANQVTGIGMGTFSWSSPQMVTEVQAWLNTPANNFGWILIGDEINNKSARRFGSKEQGTAPVLHITYNCTTPPTATCQNVVTYLDGSGISIINDADLDGGSVAVCGGNLTFSSSATTFICSDIGTGPVIDTLVISAAYDGPLSGGTPKGVELFAMYDIPDLSIYGIGSANNGGGTDGEEFSFPAVAVTAGTHIYVASEAPQFTSFFGFAPDYTTTAMSINGDDAIELFKNGQVVDVFGDINTDGTGEAWEYLDGWAYRVDGTGADGTNFNINNWTFSGPNALDGEANNGTATTPVPIGTFTTPGPGGVAVTLTVTDEGSNSATCDAYVQVFDTLAPAVSCIAPGATFTLDGTGNLTLTTGDIDNGTTDNCTLQSLTLSQTAFDCSDLGDVDVTLYATDNSGNIDSCTTTITIQSSGGLVITEDNVTDATCFGDADGSINVTVTGGSTPYTYDWDNDGTGDNDDTEDLMGLSAGTYNLTVTDNSGCSAALSSTVGSPDSLQAATSSVDVSCAGMMDGTVIATPSGGTAPFTYDWDMDGTGDTDDNPTETGVGAGVYYVTIIDANGCTVTDSATVVDGPTVDVSVTATATDITAVASGAGITYVWLECPAYTAAGSTDQTFAPTANGSYAVEITDNGCVDTSACTDITELGFEATNELSFEVYPNPANDFITIVLNGVEANVIIELIDIQGRTVQSFNATATKQTINVADFSKGVYFVSARSAEGLITKKVIIQ